MQDALILRLHGEPLREYLVTDQPLLVGRGADCDVVVHDPSVPDALCRIVRWRGAPAVDFLDHTKPVPLPLGEPLGLGRHHSLVRVRSELPPLPAKGKTEPLTHTSLEIPLALLIGNGLEARRVPLDGRTLSLGSGADVDVVIADRFVSHRHCRLEPVRGGVVLRDVGSRNGTWVQGQRVSAVELGPGGAFRIGRTDLRLVPRGQIGDARETLVAASPSMLKVLAEVEQVARLSLPVVIYGESGAGKEGIARAIHARSARRERPFVALNAGGLPAGTVESELFGHEKGAFTGASAMHRGLFEQAEGGTLFLDEIGELPLELQARLLRVLETWEVRRLGSESARRVDVRLVCATHRDLRAMVAEGRFRQDLYYRIHQLPIALPPLRCRPEDVEPLARHFLTSHEGELGPRELSREAVAVLVAQKWPGNVRELRNVVVAAAARCMGRVITDDDVLDALRRSGVDKPEVPLDEVVEAVRAHYGNVAAAARALGMPRSTVRDRVRRWEEGIA